MEDRLTARLRLCGHVHDAWKTRGRQINVGLDVWNLAPVAEDVLAKMIRQACLRQPPP